MLQTREAKVFLKKPLRSTSVIACNEMAGCQAASRIAIVINNSLDVVADVRVVGNNTPETSLVMPLSDWKPCDSKSSSVINLVDEWLPYIGVEIKTPTIATAGDIEAILFMQEDK